MVVAIDAAEKVILVDENDSEIGFGPKLDTHRDGLLHRAFSIFLFNDAGETLIQQRAAVKYHSPGKWANTCCGHPRPGEPIKAAAERRLQEELGLQLDLSFGFHARYQSKLDRDMIENEYVHVFGGRVSAEPIPEPTEVADWAFQPIADLYDGKGTARDQQTVWLQHYLDNHFNELIALQRANS